MILQEFHIVLSIQLDAKCTTFGFLFLCKRQLNKISHKTKKKIYKYTHLHNYNKNTSENAKNINNIPTLFRRFKDESFARALRHTGISAILPLTQAINDMPLRSLLINKHLF